MPASVRWGCSEARIHGDSDSKSQGQGGVSEREDGSDTALPEAALLPSAQDGQTHVMPVLSFPPSPSSLSSRPGRCPHLGTDSATAGTLPFLAAPRETPRSR